MITDYVIEKDGKQIKKLSLLYDTIKQYEQS